MNVGRQGNLLFRIGLGIAVLSMIVLRCVAPDSDAYSRLTWSTAPVTDEGFYLHNARNRILFGHPQTDEFNNALIMPLLDVVQTGVFRIIGVGTVQTRAITVVLGLLTVGFLFDALRRAFGLRTACVGGVLLGLDHVTLLYSRLGLMDTPAAFVLVCAYWLWVKSGESARKSLLWLGLCGMALGICYGVRGLGALAYPAPILLLAWEGFKARRLGKPTDSRLAQRRLFWLLGGLMLVLAVYGITWYLPNRVELTRINRYYLLVQLKPANLREAVLLLNQALFGDKRGYCSYLFRHTPVQFVLTLLGFAAWGIRRGKVGLREGPRRHALYLGLWVLTAWAVFGCVRYTPPRYYILFYPALTGIAALVLGHIEAVARTVWGHRPARTMLGGFLTYHLCEAGLHHISLKTDLILYSTVALVCVGLFRRPVGRERRRAFANRRRPATVFAVWAALNALWLGDWLTHLRYNIRDADRWLAANLPPQSVLIGDAAPGLCLNNRFAAVCVIAGLCNDYHPLETFASHPRYVVILDGAGNEERWRKWYPDTIRPEHLKRKFSNLLNFSVTVYDVPADAALPSHPAQKP